MTALSRPKGLSTKWTAHLKSTEEKEKLIKYIYGSIGVLDVLKKIVDKKAAEQLKSSTTDYDQPSWAYRQADKAGYLRALNEVTNLINLENNE